MHPSEITVIIPTMDRYDDLKLTLDSYAQGTDRPDQLVIVDQSRTDPQRIETLARSYADCFRVDYLFQEKPSLTLARNQGFRLSENELLVYSDDDITVQPDTIANIRRWMQDPELAMIGGLNLREKNATGKLGYLFCKKNWKKRHTGHVTVSMLGRFPELPLHGTCLTEWSMGFFYVVRKPLMERWGLRSDENLIGYGYAEDLDFSFAYYRHAQAEGLRCIMSEDVQVDHRVSDVGRLPSRKAAMMFVINRTYLSYKHFPNRPSARAALSWSIFGDWMLWASRRHHPENLAHAALVARRHRPELRQGILRPEWYQE